MQLIKQIIFQARQREDEPAIATATMVVSYRTLAKSVSAALDKLASLGLAPNAAVFIAVSNPIHQLYLTLALGLLGVPSASVPPGAMAGESGPAPTLLLVDAGASGPGPLPTQPVADDWFAADPKTAVDYARLLALPGAAGPDAIIRYVFSSGTTGKAKCVALTERTLDSRIRHDSFTTSGRNAGTAPTMNLRGPSTIAGILAPLSVLSRGGLFCVAPGPAAAIEMIRLFQVAYLVAAVGQVQALLEILRGRAPLGTLRNVVVTGAKMPAALLAEARAKLCPDLYFMYGSTEMGSVSMGTYAAIEVAEGSTGYILPGVSVEAVDDQGQPVRAGAEGVLRVRTAYSAFYVDEAGTRTEISESDWFYPGDIGRIFPDGLLVISGRTGDVINKGGVIIAPEVIEEVFRRDSRIRDVAAIGLPNAQGIEEICVAVVTDVNFDLVALREAARPLLREKSPDRIVRVTSIPRNANQKIQRHKLREQLLALALPPRANS